jgi:hypothetical protein
MISTNKTKHFILSFTQSIEYFSSFFPIKITNTLYELGEHTVGLLFIYSTMLGLEGKKHYELYTIFGPLALITGAHLFQKEYCDFQKEYNTDTNFIGFVEIASGVTNIAHSILESNDLRDLNIYKDLYPVFAGAAVIVLHGVTSAIANDFAHCSE